MIGIKCLRSVPAMPPGDYRNRWAPLLVVGALSIVSLPVRAYCVGADATLPNYDKNYYSVRKELGRSKYVVVARVEAETWLDEDGKPKALEPPFQNGAPRPWGFDPYSGAQYKIKVLKSYKGKAPQQLTLFSENTTARFWLNRGEVHVFFISPEVFDSPIGSQLTIDTCGNSGELNKSQDVIRQLNSPSVTKGVSSGAQQSPRALADHE